MTKERRVCAQIFTNIEIGEYEAAMHDLKQYAKEQVLKEMEYIAINGFDRIERMVNDRINELRQKMND